MSSTLRFRIRLHGTNLSERAGYDLTGKIVDELPKEQTQLRALLEEAYTRVVSAGDVLHALRDRMVDHRHLCHESLIMPLSDDGNRVDRLIFFRWCQTFVHKAAPRALFRGRR